MYNEEQSSDSPKVADIKCKAQNKPRCFDSCLIFYVVIYMYVVGFFDAGCGVNRTLRELN